MPTDEELRAPQRFPLTGDGPVTQRVIADGPVNGPTSDIGEELALARYRDHEYNAAKEGKMPDLEADRQADAYWQNKLAQGRMAEQNAQAYAATQRQAAPIQPQTETQVEQPKQTLSL